MAKSLHEWTPWVGEEHLTNIPTRSRVRALDDRTGVVMLRSTGVHALKTRIPGYQIGMTMDKPERDGKT